jgi:hypothetical protein
MYDATSGGNLVALDAEVFRWEDLSGNARHATQPLGADTKPRRKVGVASNEAIVADETGTDEGFTTLANPAQSVNATYLIAAKTSDSNYVVISSGASDFFDACDANSSVPYQNAGTPTYRVNGASVTATRTALRTARGSDAHILSVSSVNMSAANFQLIRYNSGAVYTYTGDLYLVCCYTTAPSTPLLRRMEHAMSRRLKFACS